MTMILLAARAKDNIFEDNKLVRTTNAGPLYYLKKQLDILNPPYTSAQNISAEVNIYIHTGSETGKIVKNDKIFIPDDINTYEYCIISTVSPRAIDLSELNTFPGTIFLDIQGFARSTESKTTELLKTIGKMKNIKYVKGTSEEVKRFINANPPDSLENKVIVETSGSANIKVYENDEEHLYEITTKVNTHDTIGAGDTFLASFAHEIVKQATTAQAVTRAIEDTCKFLKLKVNSS